MTCVHRRIVLFSLYHTLITYAFFAYYLRLYFRITFGYPVRIVSVLFASIFHILAYIFVFSFRNICVYISVWFPSILSVLFASIFRRLFPPAVLFPSYVRILSQRCKEPPAQPDLMRGDIDRIYTYIIL